MDAWQWSAVVALGASALKDDPKLERLKGFVQDSGEGRWMLVEALDKDVPIPTLSTALFTRFRSQQEESALRKCSRRFAMRLVDIASESNGPVEIVHHQLPTQAGMI